MSTRCQIGFYASEKQSINKPSALIYRHSDGYPDTEHGVLTVLVPWAKDFNKRRGLSDAEYAGARALTALINDHEKSMSELGCYSDGLLGYGICGDHGLHGDIEYFYRVDPSGISVYETKIQRSGDPKFGKPIKEVRIK